MKSIIEEIIKIVEESSNDEYLIKKNLTDYFNNNKETIENKSKTLSHKLDQAMSALSDTKDFGIIMQTMMKVITDEIGEDNLKKIMEFQQKYPNLKDITEKIIPKKSK